MRPVLTRNELGVREIEIAEGVVVSTPSVTHLLGLPHHGSPLAFSHPFKIALFLRNKAHISVRRGTREIVVNAQKLAYNREESGQ
jgi:hypothetical protein